MIVPKIIILNAAVFFFSVLFLISIFFKCFFFFILERWPCIGKVRSKERVMVSLNFCDNYK